MLSTPPAFNLSQNQTLQFKSVAKISVGRKSESQSSFPFAIHLSMNHTDSLGAKQLFTPLRFRCQQVFFHFRESFFSRPRRGNSLARGRLMSHFQTRVKNFFAIRENFFSRRPFGRSQLVGANGFMRLFDPTVKHFPQKILRICALLTVYSINIPKRHRKMFGFFFAIFHFLLPFLLGKSTHSLLEKASFSLQETILPFRPASYFFCHGIKGHTEGRKIHRAPCPGCDIESTACCPFP